MIRKPPFLQSLVGLGNKIDAHWQRWFDELVQAVNNGSTPTPPAPTPDPLSFVISGAGSVTADGSVAGGEFTVTLENDKDNPPPNSFYGANVDGEKGFVPVYDALEEGQGIAIRDSGYIVIDTVGTPDDLPLTGNAGEAVRVTESEPGLYAWDGAAFTLDPAATGIVSIALDATLDQLNDVDAATPTTGDVLTFDGTNWANQAPTGYPSGTSFPGSPTAGDRFDRTDLNLLCYYDGTRWLTMTEYSVALTTLASAPFQTTGGANAGRSSPRLDYGTYMTRYQCVTRVDTTNNGSNYWAVTLSWDDATVSAGTTISTVDTSADTAGTYANHSSNINAVLDATAMAFYLSVAKTGSPGQFTCNAQLFYRLVIT